MLLHVSVFIVCIIALQLLLRLLIQLLKCYTGQKLSASLELVLALKFTEFLSKLSTVWALCMAKFSLGQ